jgi:hypothetical protein
MSSPRATSPSTMTDRQPSQTTNLDIYGDPPMPWSRAHDELAVGPQGPTPPFFLPHSAGVGVVWHDGDLYFTSGPGTRKARNLRANPACTISVRLPGIDLVLEGEAHRSTDPDRLESVAALYRDAGWPCEVDGDAFTAPYSAPSAGPPPWHLYCFTFDTVFGVATAEPYGATRWRF